MLFHPLFNKDSGLVARGKINSMLSALIEGDDGINAAWILLRSLERICDDLAGKDFVSAEELEEGLDDAHKYTDREVNKVYIYVDGISGIGGLIPDEDFDPSYLPTDKSVTLIALGAGTFTHFLDVTDTPITIENPNAITIFFRPPGVTYWDYRSNIIQAPPMDDTPTEGNTTHVVSSDGIYEFVTERSVDRLSVADTTSNNNRRKLITYSLRKNVGTSEEPSYETIGTFNIPTATSTKAGLMPTFVDGIFDVSTFRNDTFATLTEVLAQADANIPTEYRKAGMTIKFRTFNEGDGEYEQWRYKHSIVTGSVFTNPESWVKVGKELEWQEEAESVGFNRQLNSEEAKSPNADPNVVHFTSDRKIILGGQEYGGGSGGGGGIPVEEKGAPGGVATLDGEGKIPAEQLPQYTDATVDLKGRRQGSSIPRYASRCRFLYDGEAVEAIPYAHGGVNGTLVFADVYEEGIENALLYNIVGRTIMNVWSLDAAPNWTKYWTTKSQAEMIAELRDNLSLITNF